MLRARVAEARRRQAAAAHDRRAPGSSSSEADGGNPRSEASASPPPKKRNSYILQRMISDETGCAVASSSWQPESFPSAGWWTRPLRHSTAPLWEKLMARGLQFLPDLHEGCAGLASGFMAASALSIPLSPDGGTASDCKEHSRQFQVVNLPQVRHIFADMKQHARLLGHDHRSGRPVHLEFKRTKKGKILIIGSPCQPFTQQRANQIEVPPEDHPLYRVTFGRLGDADEQWLGDVFDMIEGLDPDVFILENVMGFTHRSRRTGMTHLEKFVNKLMGLKKHGQPRFAAKQVFQMDASPWLATSRVRTLPITRYSHVAWPHQPLLRPTPLRLGIFLEILP